MPVETPPTPRFSRALEEELRERAMTRRRRRMPSLRPLVALAAVAAAFAFVLLPTADETGEQASPPRPLTVTTKQLLSSDRAELRRLEREFAALGEELIVEERGVAPTSPLVGRVMSLQTPGPGREGDEEATTTLAPPCAACARPGST